MVAPAERPKRSSSRKPHLAACAMLLLATTLVPSCGGGGGGSSTTGWILLAPEEIRELPMTGPAWNELNSVAQESINSPDLSDQNDRDNIRILAKALVHVRTGDATLRNQVIDACRDVIGTQGGTTLPLARELAAYVIAAQLVGLPSADAASFRSFLLQVRGQVIDGRTLISTHRDRPNNWGTHAGASRIAIARYVGDAKDLADAARVFRGYLGDATSYAGFDYGDLWWQSNSGTPVGINPAGATLGGENVDGVLPDDQRRAGNFTWPPPQENYVYEALQGVLLQALLLEQAGYDDVWAWEDQAILRAFEWLNAEAAYPAQGDDEWQPFLVNHIYGTSFPTVGGGAEPGKNFGFTDWLFPAP